MIIDKFNKENIDMHRLGVIDKIKFLGKCNFDLGQLENRVLLIENKKEYLEECLMSSSPLSVNEKKGLRKNIGYINDELRYQRVIIKTLNIAINNLNIYLDRYNTVDKSEINIDLYDYKASHYNDRINKLYDLVAHLNKDVSDYVVDYNGENFNLRHITEFSGMRGQVLTTASKYITYIPKYDQERYIFAPINEVLPVQELNEDSKVIGHNSTVFNIIRKLRRTETSLTEHKYLDYINKYVDYVHIDDLKKGIDELQSTNESKTKKLDFRTLL